MGQRNGKEIVVCNVICWSGPCMAVVIYSIQLSCNVTQLSGGDHAWRYAAVRHQSDSLRTCLPGSLRLLQRYRLAFCATFV